MAIIRKELLTYPFLSRFLSTVLVQRIIFLCIENYHVEIWTEPKNSCEMCKIQTDDLLLDRIINKLRGSQLQLVCYYSSR